MADPLHYRDWSNPRLEERWKREGDSRARDILLARRWRKGNLAAAQELLRYYEPLFEAECGIAGLTEEDDRIALHEELQLNLLIALRRGDPPNWFASFYRTTLFRLLAERRVEGEDPIGRQTLANSIRLADESDRDLLLERALSGKTARELARSRQVTIDAIADALMRASDPLSGDDRS
ncbi:MAG: hypothetical protein RL885_19850 [Planctomycetota bacterium]